VVTYLQSGQIKRVYTNATGLSTPVALTGLTSSAAHDALLSDDGAKVIFTLGPVTGSGASIYRIPSDAPSEPRARFNIFAPHFLSANGVADATSTSAPSPGSLFTVYGANLAVDELTQAAAFPLPPALAGLSLLVNGQAVPLLAVTPWQVNAQLPQTVSAGIVAIQGRPATGAALAPISVTVASTAPANFAYPFVQGRLAYQQAAAFHAGTALPADMDHPVAAGDTIEIYGVGFGVTDPTVEAGLPSPSLPLAKAVQTPHVVIGGRDAVVTFAGLAPGYAGVYHVNVIVPAGLTSGMQTLGWRGPAGLVSYSSVALK